MPYAIRGMQMIENKRAYRTKKKPPFSPIEFTINGIKKARD